MNNRKIVKTYKDLYLELKRSVPQGVIVVDMNPYGFCLNSIFLQTLIYVSPSLSWKKRIFTLTHEIGHYHYLKGNQIVRSKAKDTANEKVANKRAVKILECIGLNCKKEYYKFYEEIKNKVEKYA